ncbi:hypothetical protein M3Y97_00853100 [Aphelenchoides bicaudatus]|nr:hypothetical protein M3Y97_00853100 [Aphelenchoides bicaudatus]
MAERTHISPEELERREKYLRAYQRERTLIDPFTWSHPWKAAGTMFGLTTLAGHFNNLYMQKPWYYALYPRLAGVAVLSALGYWMGVMREHHNRTRDMVVDHYVSNHPQDFERVSDIYGRPFSAVLLPWYPRRTQYRDYS